MRRKKFKQMLMMVSAILSLAMGCSDELDLEIEDAASNSHEIVGGWDANIADYPWQVSFQSSSGSHFCGGSILNSSWIVTAQHCVSLGDNAITAPTTVRIGAGSSNLSTMSSIGQIRSIDEIIPYPGYTDPSTGKDVSLLHLSTPLTLNSNVAAIPLATAADAAEGLIDPGVISTVSGWGTLSSGGSSPDRLQAVDVPIVSMSAADEAYDMILTSDQLPAGDMIDGGEDSCQGDSGGPLVVTKGTGHILAGAVSWGYGCADPLYPGLYARISSLGTWLSDIPTRSLVTLGSTNNINARRHVWKHNTVTVPAGTPVLNVHLSGGTGDGDLYVRYGSAPTLSTYTCRPYLTGNGESCSIANPTAGTWYASVYAYSAISGVTLRQTTYN